MALRTMKVISLDVLFVNESWEVNQFYLTDRTVEFEDLQGNWSEQNETDRALLRALIEAGELSGSVDDFEVDWQTETEVSIERVSDRRPMLDLTD
jgi:hypothetical protein